MWECVFVRTLLRYLDNWISEKITSDTLAGVAQWIEHQAAGGKVASSIPSQGAYLGCGPGPLLGAYKSQPINVSLPPFLPPLPSLKVNKVLLKSYQWHWLPDKPPLPRGTTLQKDPASSEGETPCVPLTGDSPDGSVSGSRFSSTDHPANRPCCAAWDLGSLPQAPDSRARVGRCLSRAPRMITDVCNGFSCARITHSQCGLYVSNYDFTSCPVVCSPTHKRCQHYHQNIYVIHFPRTNQVLREMWISPYQGKGTLRALHQFARQLDRSVNAFWMRLWNVWFESKNYKTTRLFKACPYKYFAIHFPFCPFQKRLKDGNFFQIFLIFAIFPILFSSEWYHLKENFNSLIPFLWVREKYKTIWKDIMHPRYLSMIQFIFPAKYVSCLLLPLEMSVIWLMREVLKEWVYKSWLFISHVTKKIPSNDLLTTAVSPKWVPAETG